MGAVRIDCREIFVDLFLAVKLPDPADYLLHAPGAQSRGGRGAITRSYNSMALDVKSVDCDYYRYEENSATYGGLYTGEFMVQYSWAESVAGYLDHKEGLI